MKRNIARGLGLLLIAFFALIEPSTLRAQGYKIGDVITFPDGKQGVVFYINPLDSRRGYAMAMEDLPETYAYLESFSDFSTISGIYRTPGLKYNWSECTDFSQETYVHSAHNDNRILRELHSPAALAVDYAHGWYVPESSQLDMMRGYMAFFMSIPGFQPFADASYWGCTLAMSHYHHPTYYFDVFSGQAGSHWCTSAPTGRYHIRPVHDFGDEADVEWEEKPTYSTMWVKPTTTTVYTADIAYGTDTFYVPQTVVVDTPEIHITTAVDNAFCKESDKSFRAHLTPQSDPNYIYDWSGTDILAVTSAPTASLDCSTRVNFNTEGDHELYVHAVDARGNCHAFDTIVYTVKPRNSQLPITTDAIICYGNDAEVKGVSTATSLTQYYAWYDENGILLQNDTLAPGVESILTRSHITENQEYLLAVHDDNTCQWDPGYMIVCVDSVHHAGPTPTGTFIFNAAVDRGTTDLTSSDLLSFFDEGGAMGAYSTPTTGWTHTFIADEGQVEIHIDSLNFAAVGGSRLAIYDGFSTDWPQLALLRTDGTIVRRDLTYRSNYGALTIVWINSTPPEDAHFGWAGSVTEVTPSCLVAKAEVIVKAPLDKSAILSTTNDTVCYDYTATLTARSNLDLDQYYTWWDSTLTTVLFRDTISAANTPSVFEPTHQIQDSLYYVTIHNADNCPYLPEKYRMTYRDIPDFILDNTTSDSIIQLHQGDSIAFFDPGGKTGNFPDDCMDYAYCYFMAEPGQQVILHLDTLQCSYFEVYDLLPSGDEVIIFGCYDCEMSDTTIVSTYGALDTYIDCNFTYDYGWDAYVKTDERLYELAESHVSVKKKEVEITTVDQVYSPCQIDTFIVASFSELDGVSTYSTIWVIGTDTVATHTDRPVSLTSDTIPYTIPTGTLCGDAYTYHVVFISNTGCERTSDDRNITFNESDKPTFTVPQDTNVCRIFPSGDFNAAPAFTGVPTDVTDNCTAVPTVTWTDLDTTGTDLEVRVIHRQWTVVDNCGNDSVAVQNISILPSVIVPGAVDLTCANDTAVQLCYGVADTLLHLNAPTVVSHMTGTTYTVTSNPADGYRFPVGTTTVTWYITDDNDCSNFVTCTQDVVITLPPCGTTADSAYIDGYAYSSVRIGYQCWTGENMRHTHYADNSAVDAAGYADYDNDPANDEKFGKLYSWYAAMGLAEGDDATAVPDHTRGICPEGWVIPTADEYSMMIAASGGVEYTRSPDTHYWLPSHTGTIPATGVSFLARGAGYWDSVTETFNMLLVNTNFWTSDSAANSSSAICVELGGMCNSENYVECLKDRKVSVRCIKLCE